MSVNVKRPSDHEVLRQHETYLEETGIAEALESVIVSLLQDESPDGPADVFAFAADRVEAFAREWEARPASAPVAAKRTERNASRGGRSSNHGGGQGGRPLSRGVTLHEKGAGAAHDFVDFSDSPGGDAASVQGPRGRHGGGRGGGGETGARFGADEDDVDYDAAYDPDAFGSEDESDDEEGGRGHGGGFGHGLVGGDSDGEAELLRSEGLIHPADPFSARDRGGRGRSRGGDRDPHHGAGVEAGNGSRGDGDVPQSSRPISSRRSRRGARIGGDGGGGDGGDDDDEIEAEYEYDYEYDDEDEEG